MPRTSPGNEKIAAALGLQPELTRNRRAIHAHPELGFEERQTSALVQERLREMGLKPRVLATTGVTALIPGGKPGPVVMLRCDMDALPIQEETPYEFKSGVAGKMHACGHDFHTAILLGT